MMHSCPKCGGTTIRGPFYVKARWSGSEGLVYTCATCGYSSTYRTLDQEKQREARYVERHRPKDEPDLGADFPPGVPEP